jgi:outer membrane protein assembly factor BamA
VFGTQIAGGASAYFTDMLGDHALGVAVQASGQLRDIGGQLLYINPARRWNWGASIERVPYVYGYAAVSDTAVGRNLGTNVDYVLAHIAVSGASLLTQYPLSQSKRIEFSTGYTHYGYALETRREVYVGNTRVGTDQQNLPAPSSLGLTSASVAYVGDDTHDGFTGPIAGTRYRFEATPTVGSLKYQTLLADYRRYVFFKPVTLAFRGVHYGRYGRDSDSDRLGALYLGDGSLVRGYSYNSFQSSECTAGSSTGSLAGSSCPQFDRLIGSRLALANLELRIPLVGMGGLGLVSTSSFPPIEIAPFVDAGVAWTSTSAPVWQLASNSTDRTPVASGGMAARINLFGFAVLQAYWAHPFQRPTKSGVFGFVLQPGW